VNRRAGERRNTALQTTLDMPNFVSCGLLLHCSTALIRLGKGLTCRPAGSNSNRHNGAAGPVRDGELYLQSRA